MCRAFRIPGLIEKKQLVLKGINMPDNQDNPVPSIRVHSDDLDENGFAKLWNIASASSEGNLEATRRLAASLLCFICHKNCDFVVISTTDAEYLDAWLERDSKLIYNWKEDSESVDVMTQHAEVPFKALEQFLSNNGFSTEATYKPTRAKRLDWFNNRWSLG